MATRDADAMTEAGTTDAPATLPADELPAEHDQPTPPASAVSSTARGCRS